MAISAHSELRQTFERRNAASGRTARWQLHLQSAVHKNGLIQPGEEMRTVRPLFRRLLLGAALFATA
jgi:hypothetical protein